MIKNSFLLLITLFSLQSVNAQHNKITIASPNQQLQVEIFSAKNGAVNYSIKRKGEVILDTSTLGLVRSDGDFKQLSFVSVSKNITVKDHYEMSYAKKSIIDYKASKRIIKYVNAQQQPIDIVFQVSNDRCCI